MKLIEPFKGVMTFLLGFFGIQNPEGNFSLILKGSVHLKLNILQFVKTRSLSQYVSQNESQTT